MSGGEEVRPARVLVVEDDPTLADLVARYLRRDGHRVDVAHDGALAARKIDAGSWDLLILDVMLPGVDGLALLQRARRTRAVPAILVTARTREDERIEGLDLGADDYVTKPFLPRELMARVRAVLRRTPPADGVRAVLGPLVVDEAGWTASVRGRTLKLTATEFRILASLARAPGSVHARGTLVRCLPEEGRNALDRTVDVHVRNLRRKLGEALPGGEQLIRTVVGAGYRLDPTAAGP